MGQTVQFKGKETVLAAYSNRQSGAWSIWQSKQFMFRGYGEDDLSSVLTALEQGGTNAIYTLRIYDEIEDVEKIKSNTPDDGSFNFKLNAETQELTQSQYTSYHLLQEKIQSLENKIEELEDQEPELNAGGLSGILDNPQIKAILPVIIERVIKNIFPEKNNMPENNNNHYYNPAPAPARIAGIEHDQELLQAAKELQEYDKDLVDHLRKLVVLAQTNPETFKMLISSL